MSLLSRLFGAKGADAAETVTEYQGFRIYPTPAKEGPQYRINARIEMDVDGETKVHHLIRADTIAGLDDATEATITKAKQVIDEQGVGIFR